MLIGAMIEVLFLLALVVGLVMNSISSKVFPEGVLLMLLVPIPILILEMVLYHRRYFLDLLFVSIASFSGREIEVSRKQNRRCDDYIFVLSAEGSDGQSERFFLSGDLMKTHDRELMQVCSTRGTLAGPVSFRYLKRSKYVIELLQWPLPKETMVQTETHSKKWLKKQRRKQQCEDISG